MTVEPNYGSGPDPDQAGGKDPGTADDDQVQPTVLGISALFPQPGRSRMMGAFADQKAPRKRWGEPST